MRRLGVVVLACILLVLGLNAPAAAGERFVTRDGARLVLDGKQFRFGGPNIYWLGLDENVGGIAYPTRFRIRDALQTARGMGATVVRAHTLGVSTGDPLSLQPGKDTFNENAFASIDYAIAEAAKLDLRLVVPLTDQWDYYHGSHRDFTDWLGLPPDAFYTDRQAIDAFKRYVDKLLTHKNPLTGKRYRDDPTILAWELGNELNGMTEPWVREISSYLKDLAPRHLVAAGRQSGVDAAALSAPEVDIVDVHYYPPTAERIATDAQTVTAAGKVYIAGEYGSGSANADLLGPIASDQNVGGALFWSLFAHNDTHGYVQHDDGFTLHYPGDDPQMRQRAKDIEAFQRAVCTHRCAVRVPLGRPTVTSATKRFGMNVLAWRGTAMAAGYRVERSTSGRHGPWRAAQPDLVTDNQTPWLDLASPRQRAWYRVVPVDVGGRTGPPSDPVLLKAYDGPDAPPAAFDQLTPAPDATEVKTRPEFVWADPGNAAYFRLIVSEHADLSTPVVDLNGLQQTRIRPATELALDKTYYWKVVATNVVGSTDATQAGAAFTTGRPSTPTSVEDFESYATAEALRAAYPPNPGGDPVTLDLTAGESGQAMRFACTLGTSGYAGVIHDLPTAQDWWGLAGLRFWLRPDGSGRGVTVQFVASGYYWETTITPTGTEPRVVTLPFEAFDTPPWATPGPLDLNTVTQLAIYVGGDAGAGELAIDSITAVPFG